MSKYTLSVLIPSRNELFLSKTVEDLLENSSDTTEIIVVCDGNWPDPPVKDHPRVTMIYHSESIGQRAATNEAARLSRAKYVMKCDAHCSFAKGFDEVMIADMQDDVTMVPVMRNLHAFDWVCKNNHRRYQGPSGPCTECGEPTERDVVWIAKGNPQSTSYIFDEEPHFQYWRELKDRDAYKKQKIDGMLTETMSLQGSCWMLTRQRYFDLGIDDNDFGSWGSQGIEVAAKSWLGGGRVLVNHKTYYAHMFRTQGGDFGFPYSISGRQVQHAKRHAKSLFFNNMWKGQKRNLSWLLKKFWPIPGWTEATFQEVCKNDLPHLEKWNAPLTIEIVERKEEMIEPKSKEFSIVYYTDCRCNPQIANAVRKQVEKCINGNEIINVSLAPINWGHQNIVLNEQRSVLTMFKQILKGVEAASSEYIYFCFPKGTYVETDTGIKKIDEIEIGDMVRTHLNRFKPVKKVFKREYRPQLPLLQINMPSSKIKCTPEHPFYIYRNGEKLWIAAKNLRNNDRVLYPYEHKIDHVNFNIKLKSSPYGGKFGSMDREINDIEVDEDLARFMGLFLAEGHCNGKNGIGFTFNNNEIEYIEFIKNTCFKKFNREAKSRTHWATQVLINISGLCPLFKKWFGDHSHTRKIPDFVFDWNLKNRLSFIKGFLEGDGTKHEYQDGLGYCGVTVSSKQLIEDLILLMDRSGIGYNKQIKPLCTGKNSKGIEKWSYRLNLKKDSYFKILDILSGNIIDDYIAIPIMTIKSIKKTINYIWENKRIIECSSYVYNLEVEEDNSYIVGPAIVHNCEHDVLYHPSHFAFVPPKDDVFYYDENRWFVDYNTGRALFYHACSTSLLVANRELLVEHYRKRVKRVEKEGFTLRLGYEPGNHPYPRGVDLHTRATYFAECPSLDIRHRNNLTPTRWSKEQFRNQRNLHAWKEADEVPCWGIIKNNFKNIIDSIEKE